MRPIWPVDVRGPHPRGTKPREGQDRRTSVRVSWGLLPRGNSGSRADIGGCTWPVACQSQLIESPLQTLVCIFPCAKLLRTPSQHESRGGSEAAKLRVTWMAFHPTRPDNTLSHNTLSTILYRRYYIDNTVLSILYPTFWKLRC